MHRFDFTVRGSKGDHYAVVFELYEEGLVEYCSCPAGQHGSFCKHRNALLAGEVTALLSANLTDVEALQGMLRGTDLEKACKELAVARERMMPPMKI